MSPALADTTEVPADSAVFTDYTEAIAFLRRRGGRYSIKPVGAGTSGIPEFTGQRADAADVMAVLSLARAANSAFPENTLRFALVETVEYLQ